MAEEPVYLESSGNIPGLPGNHGPGWYLIDYEERTIRPKPIEQGEPLAQLATPSDLALDENTGQSETHIEESVAPAIEHATPEAETTPSTEAQQPMEVVVEPISSDTTRE